jgi:hypothetical protein
MILNEISMAPSDLKSRVAKLTNATVGLEFELIVKDVGYGIGDDVQSEPDYEETDERVLDSDWMSLNRDIKSFFVGDHNTRSEIQTILATAKKEYDNWLDDQWSGYVKDTFGSWLENVHSKKTSDLNDDLDEYLDQFKEREFEEFAIDGGGSLPRWIKAEDLDTMVDWTERYGISWPVWTREQNAKYVGNGSQELKDIARSFREVVNMKVEYSTEYHSLEREDDIYVLEPDESLETMNHNDVGLEFVSPPMSVDMAIDHIHKVKKWCIEDDNAYTNDTCGLHMNVSFPDFTIWDLDYVKLVVFSGDDYIAEQFGRLGNHYAKSSIDTIKEKIDDGGPKLISAVIDHLKKALYNEASGLIHRGSTEKYITINPKNNRVEFRAPGGDWLKMDLDKVINTMLRFVIALDIAINPEKFKKRICC